jgi:hypothetical protein
VKWIDEYFYVSMSRKAFCLTVSESIAVLKEYKFSDILKYFWHMKQKSKFCSRTIDVHLHDAKQIDILEMK